MWTPTTREQHSCYSAPSFDPTDFNDVNRLGRRWASNTHA